MRGSIHTFNRCVCLCMYEKEREGGGERDTEGEKLGERDREYLGKDISLA